MENPILLETRHGAVSLLTLHRPDKLNALNRALIGELGRVLRELEADRSVRCIVLTGSGDKAFAAGADISEFSSFEPGQGEALSREGHLVLFDYIPSMKTPVLAAINGYALGGGLELAMSCHFRYASQNAKLGLPEVTLGLIPGYGGTQRLARLVGKGLAIELIASARMMNAEEALSRGLVNRVLESDQLVNAALETAQKIALNSAWAIERAIELIELGERDLDAGLEAEMRSFGSLFRTPDFEEGTQAFIEKRKPKFN
jgi:enoyl-CoA hydratase